MQMQQVRKQQMMMPQGVMPHDGRQQQQQQQQTDKQRQQLLAARQAAARRAPRKELHHRIVDAVPEAKFYTQLCELEARIDYASVTVQEELKLLLSKAPPPTVVMRITVASALQRPQGEGKWSLHVTGKLLDAASAPNIKLGRPFTAYFKRIEVRSVNCSEQFKQVWTREAKQGHVQQETDGFEVRRVGLGGDREAEVEVEFSLIGDTPVFTMSNNPELAAVLNAGADWKGTQEELTSMLWAYVKKSKLQDAANISYVVLDNALKNALPGVPHRIMLTQLTPNVLQNITRVNRATIKYRVRLDEEIGEPKSIDMCVPSSSSDMVVNGIKNNLQSAYASVLPAGTPKVEDMISSHIEAINSHKKRRDFFKALSERPVDFLHTFLASQLSDMQDIRNLNKKIADLTCVAEEVGSGIWAGKSVEKLAERYEKKRMEQPVRDPGAMAAAAAAANSHAAAAAAAAAAVSESRPVGPAVQQDGGVNDLNVAANQSAMKNQQQQQRLKKQQQRQQQLQHLQHLQQQQQQQQQQEQEQQQQQQQKPKKSRQKQARPASQPPVLGTSSPHQGPQQAGPSKPSRLQVRVSMQGVGAGGARGSIAMSPQDLAGFNSPGEGMPASTGDKEADFRMRQLAMAYQQSRLPGRGGGGEGGGAPSSPSMSMMSKSAGQPHSDPIMSSTSPYSAQQQNPGGYIRSAMQHQGMISGQGGGQLWDGGDAVGSKRRRDAHDDLHQGGIGSGGVGAVGGGSYGVSPGGGGVSRLASVKTPMFDPQRTSDMASQHRKLQELQAHVQNITPETLSRDELGNSLSSYGGVGGGQLHLPRGMSGLGGSQGVGRYPEVGGGLGGLTGSMGGGMMGGAHMQGWQQQAPHGQHGQQPKQQMSEQQFATFKAMQQIRMAGASQGGTGGVHNQQKGGSSSGNGPEHQQW